MDFFDLHCDTTTSAMEKGLDFSDKRLDIHFPITEKIGKHVQCFAIFTPDSYRGKPAVKYYERAKLYFSEQLKRFSPYAEQVLQFKDIDRIIAEGKTAAILTVEGGCVIDGNIERLHQLKNDGVKMMTLTWNGENEIGFGAPTPEMGLKHFGFDVIREMKRIGMVIDIAHLSDKGIEDVFSSVDGALVSSHSNLRSCCNHHRNLTEEQFREIVRRKGLVGVNFYKNFLNEDGEKASLDDAVRHIERMLALGGEDTVCMGSDYDGCDVVSGIEKPDDIENLYEKLKNHGFSDDLLRKIFWKNAYRFFGGQI